MNVLDFQTDKLITGVNVIEGNLYWTDDNSEPKKLEIERFKEDDIGLNSGATTIDGRLFDHTDITVIRPHPFKGIDLELIDYDDEEFDEQRVTSPEPPFEQIFPRFSYRWRYEDGQYSPYAPFTQPAFISRDRNLGEAGDPQNWDPQAAYQFDGTNGVVVNFENRSYENTVTIEAPLGDTVNPDPRADSARWNDVGVAILNSQEANYIEGFNTTMFNNVGRIVLNNIPRGTADVTEIDILYTESISATIYVLETLLIPETQRGIDFTLNSAYIARVQADGSGVLQDSDYNIRPLSFNLTTRKIFNALPANQLTRPFDNVPRLAKAQEVTANRLIYGNYLHQYDQQVGVSMDVVAIPAESFPGITDSLIVADRLAASATDGLHVKGDRTYEIGVAYIDAFGRQGAMLQNISTFNADGTTNEAAAFRTAFNQATREALQVTISTPAPSWADSYRYFIKDVSMDHHNLISYNIYNDGGVGDIDSEFIWIEFQSTDRNKIQGGPGDVDATVLTLRRVNDDIQSQKVRFLVQDIENEAPDDVRAQINRTIVSSETANTGSFNHSAYETVSDLTSGAISRGTVNGQTEFFLSPQNAGEFQSQVIDVFNNFITRVEGVETIDTAVTATIDFTILSQPLYARLRQPSAGQAYATGGEDTYVEITSVSTNNGGANRLGITFGDRFLVNPATREIERLNIGVGLSSTVGQDLNFELLTTRISESAVERLGGRFWVRAARNSLVTEQSQFTFEGALVDLAQHWFETEPIIAESNLDLFWESSETFCVCTDHGWPNKINWYNSVAESTPSGVYLETTRIFDKFNSVQLVRGVRANIPTERFKEERRPYGLTWSGIYNSRTGINRLNQFITEDGITKELEPNYGSLQKLHTRDTNLIAACEDKFFRILADKDLLFNADGGGNVSAASQVLGQTTPFIGEYGISTHPESFASYGHNFWCTDAKRGVVIQITPGNGQVNEISKNGLDDFFRDRLFSADRIIGMYDDYGDSYTLSIQGYNQLDPVIDPNDMLPSETSEITLKYETSVEGWPAFTSFIPEDGLTLNNKFYTWKNGLLYMHNSNVTPRNHFYDLPMIPDVTEGAEPGAMVRSSFPSRIEVVFNDEPSAVKEFLTLGYEGTPGWTVTGINTENQDLPITDNWPFINKEGKYFSPIVSYEDQYIIDPAGTIMADDGVTTLSVSGQAEKSGIKGFYNVISLENTSGVSAELFAINTELFLSSN